MEQIPLGEIVITHGIEQEMSETYGFKEFCMHCLIRHRNGDWGDTCREDRELNEKAASEGGRLMSVYRLPRRLCIGYAEAIWVITEEDRSFTTILFPYEY